ncbi:MAG: YifB family Mg chelatase-like AAA ATPase [Candidatus Gracilibacteria bacterium]|jgi:magnesium chelatase family protein
MTAKIYSCSFTGLECRIIEVQADISNGLSAFSIVGMGDISVQESKERIRSSIKNSGLTYPQTKKTVNLAPAQIRKQGTLFDLPIATSLLIASGQIANMDFKDSIVIGELSLSGHIRAINGALSITQYAKSQGFKNIFLPMENALEASFVEGINVYPLNNLKDFFEFCCGKKGINIQPHQKINLSKSNANTENSHLFSQIVGHEKAKRALAIAASGRHNILFCSSPGCGKTILARAFKDLLPAMTEDEILETTKIHSIAGLIDRDMPLITSRPFREIHHTASPVSIIGGGGMNPKPGEISLAHNGVLFLDEITEFQRIVLEALRQPLEDKYIHITRSNFSVKFPCNFILIATMNPCQCGYKHDKKIKCICTESQLSNYKKRLSGPILDRFDLFLDIEKIPINNFFDENFAKNEAKKKELKKSVELSGFIQRQRFREHKNIRANSDMNLAEIRDYCHLEPDAEKILNQAATNLNLSNRGYLRTLKIARTIADLAGEENISFQHITEAVQYREQN